MSDWQIFITFIAIFYFLPAAIAGLRGHPHLKKIFLVNLFLGWSVIGWWVALIWSFTSPAFFDRFR